MLIVSSVRWWVKRWLLRRRRAKESSLVARYNPLQIHNQEQCEESFTKVGRGGYDQSKVVLAFCPPEARAGGCFVCRYCPPQYKGLTKWQYRRFKKRGRTPEPKVKEDFVKMGAIEPRDKPFGGSHG